MRERGRERQRERECYGDGLQQMIMMPLALKASCMTSPFAICYSAGGLSATAMMLGSLLAVTTVSSCFPYRYKKNLRDGGSYTCREGSGDCAGEAGGKKMKDSVRDRNR